MIATAVLLLNTLEFIWGFFMSFFLWVAAERRAVRRKEEKLLEAAREGDVSTLSKMVSPARVH